MQFLKRILNSDKKPLLKNEFNFIFPEEEYESYLLNYYERKIGLLYKYNYNKVWFKERYLENKKIFIDYEKNYKIFIDFINQYGLKRSYDDLYLEEGNFYVLFTLPDHFNMDQFAKDMNIMIYSYVQNDSLKLYSRTGIFIVEDEDRAYKICEKLNSLEFNNCDVRSAISFKKKASFHSYEPNDINRLLNILNFLNMKCNTAFEIPENCTDKFLYGIYLLRFAFHFCFYCFKKYDSERHFFINCGDIHTYSYISNEKDRKIFERNFLFLNFDSKKLTGLEIKNILLITYIRYDNRKNICTECNMELPYDDEYRLQHFKNYHSHIYEKIFQAVDNSKIFLRNMDIFIFEIINNFTNTKQLPDLLRNFNRYNVRYDLPFIYDEI